MDRGGWRATVHRVTKSRTQLTDVVPVTYTWNLKCDTNEFTYATETDSQIQRTDLRLPRGEWVGKGRTASLVLADVSNYIGEGNGTPLQYSCLENPMDGGAW